jgi:(1->4)-alpha-D-glucan 1-alpha-D-glucosylmutase
VRELVHQLADGRAKLYLIHCTLGLRRAYPALFEQGDYQPVRVQGTHAERLCAFTRTHAGRSIIVMAPRLLAAVMPPNGEDGDPFADPGWSSTSLEVASDNWWDQLSALRVHASPHQDHYLLPAADVLRRFPVGLLTSEAPHHA